MLSGALASINRNSHRRHRANEYPIANRLFTEKKTSRLLKTDKTSVFTRTYFNIGDMISQA